MIKEYRKVSTIKAEQFDGSDEMMEKYRILPDYNYGLRDDHWFEINHNTEDEINLLVGDWIVTGSNGEHCVIRDDIFKKTYEPVNPKGILYYTSQKKLAKFLDSYGLTVVSNELATKILKLLSDDQ